MKERVVKEWIEKGELDIDAVKILIRDEKYFHAAVFHIHQAIEKYLKGYLIHNDWRLEDVHDLGLLIPEAIKIDAGWQKYLDLGKKLTAFYYEERHPTGPVTLHSKEEVEEMLKAAEEIIDLVQEGIKPQGPPTNE